MTSLPSLFITPEFQPLGAAFHWSPPLLWLYATANVLIVIPCYAIPAAFAYFVWQHRDLGACRT